MSTIIHRNNAPRNKIVASNVLMGLGDNKNDNVEKRINDLEEKEVDVEVTPLLSEGVHIADIKVNNQTAEIYAPQGGGQGTVTDVKVNGQSVVDQYGEAEIDLTGKQDVIIPGQNIQIAQDGKTISATDTTYAVFIGATSQQDGSSGLVPAPLVTDKDKFLKGDGTWGEAGGGSGTVTDVLVDGVSVVNQDGEAEITMPSVPSDLDDLSDVNVSSLSDGDVLTYNATTQKWENGESGGDKYAPIIYSLEEREVGVWTDWKPLYEITIHINALPSTTYTLVSYSHGIVNVDKICDYQAVARWTSGEISHLDHLAIPAASVSDIAMASIETTVDTTNIYIRCGADRSLLSADYTIRYTKTTDVPGSGTWGTDGVPMVQYDGTERIIGTWFGETLYTKTYHYTGTLNSNAWVTLDSSRLPSNTPYFSVMNVCFISTQLSSSAKISAYATNIPFDIAISTGEQLYFENKSNYKIYEFVITIQYTKNN